MNEIEFPADRIDYRERDAANADDASAIRARVTPPANEPDAGRRAAAVRKRRSMTQPKSA